MKRKVSRARKNLKARISSLVKARSEMRKAGHPIRDISEDIATWRRELKRTA